LAAPKKNPGLNLSRRERQIMQAVYKTGQATVAEIVAAIDDPPTPDAIRRMCHILEDKGQLKSEAAGNRRIYKTTVTRGRAGRHALTDVVDTFFAGSPRMLVATLLDTHKDQLTADDIARLRAMVDEEGDS